MSFKSQSYQQIRCSLAGKLCKTFYLSFVCTTLLIFRVNFFLMFICKIYFSLSVMTSTQLSIKRSILLIGKFFFNILKILTLLSICCKELHSLAPPTPFYLFACSLRHFKEKNLHSQANQSFLFLP